MNFETFPYLNDLCHLPYRLEEQGKKIDQHGEEIDKVGDLIKDARKQFESTRKQFESTEKKFESTEKKFEVTRKKIEALEVSIAKPIPLPPIERAVFKADLEKVNAEARRTSACAGGLSISLILAITAIALAALLLWIPALVIGAVSITGISVSSYYLHRSRKDLLDRDEQNTQGGK